LPENNGFTAEGMAIYQGYDKVADFWNMQNSKALNFS